MSARVTRKRARTEEEESQVVKPEEASANTGTSSTNERTTGISDFGEPSQLKKDEEFWFDDGTVILHAGDVEFRVYRGLLESHSTVLAELFAQPHSTRAVSFGGKYSLPCPIVKLSDTPYDVRHVLRCCIPRDSGRYVWHEGGCAFVDTTSSPFKIDSVAPSFDLVSAAIRSGHKYKFNDMYQKGLSLLKRHYSDSFDVWDSTTSWSPSGWLDAQAIGVINLARLTGELSLLPVAFMVCVLNLDADLVRGFMHEDGSQEHLTLDDIGLCFHARNRLREASVAALFRVLSAATAVPGCKVSSQCSKVLRNAFRGKKAEENVGHLTTGDVFLYTASTYFGNGEDGTTLCQACSDVLKEQDLKENRIMWDRLPELLGIEVPGWGKSAAAPAPAPAPAT